jgi:hypothetical protein
MIVCLQTTEKKNGWWHCLADVKRVDEIGPLSLVGENRKENFEECFWHDWRAKYKSVITIFLALFFPNNDMNFFMIGPDYIMHYCQCLYEIKY